MSRVVALCVLVLLSACMRPPAPLVGHFPPMTVADARAEDHTGERVRWGGTIVSTTPRKDATCIEIVALPLDRRGRPRETDDTFGRFIACAPGFYDPVVFAEKREVTVVGDIDGRTSGKVGEYDYTFPRVAADVVYLWPERRQEDRAYYYGGPYWYPYWWGWYDPPPPHHRR